MKMRNVNRRQLLQILAGTGIGTASFQRALAAQAENSTEVTAEMVRQAEWIAGLELTEEQRAEAAGSLNRSIRSFHALREVPLDYDTPPALVFRVRTEPDGVRPQRADSSTVDSAAAERPDNPVDLAFMPVTDLASLIRRREITSEELTRLYLERLRAFNKPLNCLVTATEELAIQEARRADAELRAGNCRGPLHGIPWGAKDLIGIPGYPTTWGATQFEHQTVETKATVARRLEEAGAVLVGKLSLGALASGDRWFRGQTRNPWNMQEGSSGSSAGSASATAAGLVGFAIGSETNGSILSPCRRCGVSGLRPTFGRISRHGCMPLAWSMDKLGPIARTLEDCAVIFQAIHGSDGYDPSAVDHSFQWPVRTELSQLKVGYIADKRPVDQRPELRALKELGVQLVEIKIPQSIPASALISILYTEAGTAFDQLTRSGDLEGLNSWPRLFRQAQFVPAVEYLRANRLRYRLMEEFDSVFDQVDLYVDPQASDLTLTNLTGHPKVILPFGVTERNGVSVPDAITFTGPLYSEEVLLAVGTAIQRITTDHLRRPPIGSTAEPPPDTPEAPTPKPTS